MKKNQPTFSDQLFLTVTNAFLSAERANPKHGSYAELVKLDAQSICKYVEAILEEKSKLDEKLNPPKVKTDEVIQ